MKGHLFVVSGPSGVGKGTIVKRVLTELDDIELSISMTTRQPRSGEVNGKDYYFTSTEDFVAAIEADNFLEHANVYGNYYGTPKKAVMDRLEKGIDVLLEIDVQGAMCIKANYPEGKFVFIKPPSLEELRNRICGRGKDSPEVIERRMKEAAAEIAQADQYTYTIVNDDLEIAVQTFKEIIRKERGEAL